LVLMSHLGRPKGTPMPEYSMEPVAARLAEILDIDEVVLTDSCVGDGARRVVLDLRDGEVAVLENLRFHPGETANDDKFAKDLASLGDAYVNDAFGTMHRAHASIVGVAKHIQKKAAGFLLEKELSSFGRLLGEVERPYVAVLGGAKVSDKIEMIESLLKKVDTLIIGGAMANTFAAAAGGRMGKSLVEKDKLPLARDLLLRAEQKGVRLMIPVDALSAADVNADAANTVSMKSIPDGELALDIGPETRAEFKEVLGLARTIFWNGPMGLYEKDLFAGGTYAVARAISGSAAFSVVGGGDSVAVVKRAGLEKGFDHVSTGGGASLKLIEGKVLPGIAALLPQ
jgi:phosphoglycerate kinase